MKRTALLAGTALTALFMTSPASADTTVYTYDALGRLTASTVSSGSGTVTSGIAYDPAGNRTNYSVSGATASRQLRLPLQDRRELAMAKPRRGSVVPN